MRGTVKRILLIVALVAVATGSLYVAGKFAVRAYRELVVWQGMQLNREAWEATFSERGLAIPPDGPRDGYWGARLGSHREHPRLGWILPEIRVPGLVEVDAHGMQHVASPVTPVAKLLIIGASTAFGAYASTEEKTYFHILGDLLAKRSVPVEITVFATGAWKSSQELAALREYGLSIEPDIVMFLNGLNDITNGSNAKTLFGVPTETLDGSRWHLLYNERDYPERVAAYLENMSSAQRVLHENGISAVFALQPALFEKTHLSELERRVEAAYAKHLGPREALQDAYEAIRDGLRDLSRRDGVHFTDCSRVYEGETGTTFTDEWHFSDPGHRILAEELAAFLAPLMDRTVYTSKDAGGVSH